MLTSCNGPVLIGPSSHLTGVMSMTSGTWLSVSGGPLSCPKTTETAWLVFRALNNIRWSECWSLATHALASTHGRGKWHYLCFGHFPSIKPRAKEYGKVAYFMGDLMNQDGSRCQQTNLKIIKIVSSRSSGKIMAVVGVFLTITHFKKKKKSFFKT